MIQCTLTHNKRTTQLGRPDLRDRGRQTIYNIICIYSVLSIILLKCPDWN